MLEIKLATEISAESKSVIFLMKGKWALIKRNTSEAF